MAYQEVTRTSYGKRLGNSLGGIGSGFLLIVLATILLWWNEGRAVKTAKMLEQANSECVDVPDVSVIDPSLEGKMIHAVAVAKTDDILSDPEFGINENAICLEREVAYYQWVEHASSTTKDKVGGAQETTTTYTYSHEWVSSPINSASFKDPEYQGLNSVRINVEDNAVYATNVSFGGYQLPAGMVRSIPCNTPVEVPAIETQDSIKTVHVNSNVVYYGLDPQTPAIGDVRVTFMKGEGGEASVLAKVTGNTFEPYTSNGKSLCVLSMGNRSMQDMFETEKQANKTWLWILRIIGILLVIAGFRNIFSILVTLFKVLPPLASVANLGVNIVTGVLGVVWSLIVILIAWVRFRPVLAISLLVVAVALVVWLITKSKKTKAPVAAE